MKILIVEDDQLQRTMIVNILNKFFNYEIIEASNGQEALYYLRQDEENAIKLVLMDLSMPELDGKECLKLVREVHPSMPVIIITGSEELEDAVEVMQLGGNDFITKPVLPERLHVSITNVLHIHELSEEVSRLNRKEKGQVMFEDLIGFDGGLKNSILLGRKASQSDISVLVLGENGVGKELLARSIHSHSKRAKKPFIAVNCGAIPANLVESTLFGHEKGAFTGAIAKSAGKFREADGGTLFLDEVGELPQDVQVKLLRVLQEQEVEPVGAGKPVKVNVRIISATNRNLSQAVHLGQFREDLFFRLNVFPITIVPLKERWQDIPHLIDHFIERFSAIERKDISSISVEAMERLQHHTWPGNVRELENAIFRAVVLNEDGQALEADDFNFFLEGIRADVRENDPSEEGGFLPETQQQNKIVQISSPAPQPIEQSDFKKLILFDEHEQMKSMEVLEWEIIDAAMRQCDNNIRKVAEQLGIGQSTLYRRINERDQQSGDGGQAEEG